MSDASLIPSCFYQLPALQPMADSGLCDAGLGPNPDWAELTGECLVNVLSRLTLEDRWKGAMLVCKSWLDASKDPALLCSFDLEPYFGSIAAEPPVWWNPAFESKIDAMLRTVAESAAVWLEEVRVRHCSDRSLALVAERCPNLRILSIKSCMNVTNSSMANLGFNCPMLTELDISYCHEISHNSLALIGRNCHNLRTLRRNFMNWLDPSQHTGIVPEEYLKNCPQDGDAEAAVIGKCMPNLERLEIRFSKMSAKGLTLICEGCLKLEQLDLSGCANLTSRDILNATSNLKNLCRIEKPNFYIPRSVFHTERYGHWQLYDDRFQTDVFRI